MAVVKVRASAHSKELRTFEIGDGGIVVGERVANYRGLLSGSPQLIQSASPLPRSPDKRRPRS
jgi:circadian clock protein KaiC